MDAKAGAIPNVGGGTKRVVVAVDDEPAVLSSLQRLLRSEPYEFLTTEDPAQVLAWVESRAVDAVISDQRMPRMQGDLLLEEVRARSPHTARILFTGHPGRTVILRGLARGIQYVFTKPWTGDDLRRAIRQVLEQTRVLPPEGNPERLVSAS